MQVLHPKLKLKYFCQHNWEKAWIKQAEKMIHEEYAASYEKAAAYKEMHVKTSPDQVCCTCCHSL